MAKTKTKWVCQSCGYETISYLGRCPECNQFATFNEEIVSEIKKIESAKPSNIINPETKITKINEIELDEKIRYKTKF